MTDYHVDNPVLLIVFNRPEQTRQVFDAIKKVQPKRLYLSADAPRKDVESDTALSAACKAIIENVDWDCEVKKLYHTTNQGSHTAIPDAIDWFFREEEQGIVLEDDCLPNTSFFRFCDELLEKYKDNKKVWWINGSNFGMSLKEIDTDYSFSIYPISWGWASWRRAWSQFDREMESYSGDLRSITLDGFQEKSLIYRMFWKQLFNYAKKIPNWDYRWIYTCWINDGFCCAPSVNLIKNIGFGGNATHPTNVNHPLSNIPYADLDNRVKHPEKIVINPSVNSFVEKKFYGISVPKLIKFKLITLFPYIKRLRFLYKKYRKTL